MIGPAPELNIESMLIPLASAAGRSGLHGRTDNGGHVDCLEIYSHLSRNDPRHVEQILY